MLSYLTDISVICNLDIFTSCSMPSQLPFSLMQSTVLQSMTTTGRQHMRSAVTGTLLVPRARTVTGQ